MKTAYNKASKIRVCHLASGDLWAGAEVQLGTLLSKLVNDPRFLIEAILLNDGRLADEIKRIGIKTKVIDETKRNSFGIFRELLDYFRENRVDILHTHKYKENTLGCIAARMSGVPFIVRTVHGLSEPFSGFQAIKMSLYRFLDQMINNYLVDKIVAVSVDIKNNLSPKYKSEKVICIHNGIDFSKWKAICDEQRIPSDKEVLIGTVGRLTAVKGLEYFLKAAKIILDQNADWNIRFMIIGDGPLKSSLHALAHHLSIGKKVDFLGYQDDCYKFMNKMDIFILPSLHEGIPMTLLEVLYLAKPVVATRVGGIPEVIQDDVSGLLVNPQDEKAIAQACISMINNYKWAKQLGENGKKIIEEQFSAEVNADKVAGLYHSLKFS